MERLVLSAVIDPIALRTPGRQKECHSGAERSEAIESMDPIGRPTDSLQGDSVNFFPPG